MLLTGITYASADSQDSGTKRYEVAGKKGNTKFVPLEKEGDKWKYIKGVSDIYPENGTQFEGFYVEEDRTLNYVHSPYMWQGGLIAVYEGKYYKVPFSKKDLKPVDENGKLSTGLGIRNYLSNTFMGDFYRTKTPGLIALLCAFISGIFLILSFFKDSVPVFLRLGYALPLCVISLLEIGAAFSLGTDAAWWVNPDDVGYWIATPLLIPYAIVAAQMVFSYKLYNVVGNVEGLANVVITVLLIIGIVLTVISAIFVVINFLFAACLLVFVGWMFSGISHKNNDGSTTNTGPLGSYTTDRYGNTKHTRN